MQDEQFDVAIVGGGPAGMKAACVAADRGHQVTLFEAKDHLGGAITDEQVEALMAAEAAVARVVAVDRSGPRLRRLKANLARLNLSADIVEADATLARLA